MGRTNRAKYKDYDSRRAQNARRLEYQKLISLRKKALTGSGRALAGEVAMLNNIRRPTFDSQGFQICRSTSSLGAIQGSKIRDTLPVFPQRLPPWVGSTVYFLYEFACGYALFEAHGVSELYLSNINQPLSLHFKSYEEYINRSHQIFTLKAFHPFSSSADALVQMNAISNSTLSQSLKNFLADNLPNPIDAKTRYFVTTLDPFLGRNISKSLRMDTQSGVQNSALTRGLRMNIEKFINGLVLKEIEKAQLNLARLYSRQMCTTTYLETPMPISSSSIQEVVVVPHKFEGVFIAKGMDYIYTRNLVPGEALYGEEMKFVQNEDGAEVEYRLWNPVISKLANAILCGLTNICVKPGSRILYLGDDVCQITISHLSDLVGLDGLVYVVGLSDVAVTMAKRRSNIITIFEKPSSHWKYRMVVGMVDVIYADIIDPLEVYTIVNNASFYLRAGGHYMVYTRVSNIYSTSRGKDPFGCHQQQKEFTPIEAVMLEPVDRAYAMAIGGFRMPEE